MKTCLKSLGLAALGLVSSTLSQAVTFSVDPGAAWVGYVNVFELPANGGGYVFGSGWGTADLTASFSGSVLKLGPNSIGDPASFWYVGGGGPGAAGNKIMEAAFYQQFDGPLAGQSVTFTGDVLSNTFVGGYTTMAVIRDFAPDYSSFITVSAPLTPGVFSLTLDTVNDPGRHVQIGFVTSGPNIWITDAATAGFAEVTAVAVIPEPSTVALLSGAVIGCAVLMRRRRQG